MTKIFFVQNTNFILKTNTFKEIEGFNLKLMNQFREGLIMKIMKHALKTVRVFSANLPW